MEIAQLYKSVNYAKTILIYSDYVKPSNDVYDLETMRLTFFKVHSPRPLDYQRQVKPINHLWSQPKESQEMRCLLF